MKETKSEILIGYKDMDGLPRAYASGPPNEIDTVEALAYKMLLAYIDSKPYNLDVNDFTRYQEEIK